MSLNLSTLHYPTPTLPLVRGGSQSISSPLYKGGLRGVMQGIQRKSNLCVHRRLMGRGWLSSCGLGCIQNISTKPALPRFLRLTEVQRLGTDKGCPLPMGKLYVVLQLQQ